MKARFWAAMMIGVEATMPRLAVVTWIQHRASLDAVALSTVVMMMVMASRGESQQGNQSEEERELFHG